ncbi:MAG: NADH-quinone oxidoreductase subunit NuoE [Dehalococcoidales bacterium]|nr:NADH-quinone oxidoreductase subunit NuoE [Dehalococcoidales bacterium]
MITLADLDVARIELQEKMGEIFSHHRSDRENLIPILQEIQEEFNYLPKEAIHETARYLNISESTIYGVATFYTQFKLTPQGRKVVRVCCGTACHVRGAARVLEELEKTLDIEAGETTDDLEYSLETVACLGSCALAPVVTVNDAVYGRMTPEKARQLLQK